MKKQRVELHCQTNVVTGAAIISPLDSINTAIGMGMPGIGFADTFSVDAFPEIYRAAKTVREQGTPFKILYGVSVAVFDDSNLIVTPTDYHNILKQDIYNLILFAKNEQGIRDLFRLVTFINFSETEILPMSEIEKVRKNLIVGGNCRTQLRNNAFLEDIEYLNPFYDNLDYIEIEPAENLFDNGFSDEFENVDELKSVIKEFVEEMESLEKPVVAVTNIQYKDPTWETAFRAVREEQISAGDGYNPKDYWMPTEEMLELFGFLGKRKAEEVVIKNPLEIFNQIEEVKPPFEEKFNLEIKGADSKLKTLCKNNAQNLYGKPLPKEVKQRMETELNAIIGNGFSSMFLMAHNLVEPCREAKIGIAPAGSTAASFVAFLAGITDINPLPAHYLCPACYYTEFDGKWREESPIGAAGLNLPDKKCPKCGKKLKKDGFDIPYYSFLGYRLDRFPCFEFFIPYTVRDIVESYLAGTEGVGGTYHVSWKERYDEFFAEELVKGYLEKTGKKAGRRVVFEQGEHIRKKVRSEYVDPYTLLITPKDVKITDYSPIAPDLYFDDRLPFACFENMPYQFPTVHFHQDNACDLLDDIVQITGKNPFSVPLSDKKIQSLLSSPDALGIDGTLFEKENVGFLTGTIGIPGLESRLEQVYLQLVNPKGIQELAKINTTDVGEVYFIESWLDQEKEEYLAEKASKLREDVTLREDVLLYLLSVGIEAETAVKIAEDLRKGKFLRFGIKPEWEKLLKEHGVPDWYIDSMKNTRYLSPKGYCISQALFAWKLLYFKLNKPDAFYKAWLMHHIWDIDKRYWKKDAAIKRYNNLRKKKKPDVNEEYELRRLAVVAEAFARGVDMERLFREVEEGR